MSDMQKQEQVNEQYANQNFIKVSVNLENWTVLYWCPETKTYWKKFFPFAEAQGGGAPRFIQVSREIAEKEFNFNHKTTMV